MDMIMVYKIVQGISGCPFENFFVINVISTRNNGCKQYIVISTPGNVTVAFLKEWSMIGQPPKTCIQSSNVFLFRKKIGNGFVLTFGNRFILGVGI